MLRKMGRGLLVTELLGLRRLHHESSDHSVHARRKLPIELVEGDSVTGGNQAEKTLLRPGVSRDFDGASAIHRDSMAVSADKRLSARRVNTLSDN